MMSLPPSINFFYHSIKAGASRTFVIPFDITMPSRNGLGKRLRRSSTVNTTPIHSSWSEVSSPVLVTSDSIDFDPSITATLAHEGFGVAYLPYQGDAKVYQKSLELLVDSLEAGGQYAIIGTFSFSDQILLPLFISCILTLSLWIQAMAMPPLRCSG